MLSLVNSCPRTKWKVLIVFFLFLILFLNTSNLYAFIRSRSNEGQPLFWPKRNLPITYVIDQRGSQHIPDDSEFDTIRRSFRTWEEVPTAFVSFKDGGLTDKGAATAPDGINFVTFVKNDPDLPGGTIGLTTTFFFRDGRIIDADIKLNEDFVFTTTENPKAIDLESVVTHEVGHLLGLDHEIIRESTMFPATKEGEAFQRTLSQDDIAGVSSIYPLPSFLENTATIIGTVTSGVMGSPVFGAHLVALNSNSKTPVVGGISLGNGTYTISGLPPGEYLVMLEPMRLQELGGFFQSGQRNFPIELFDDATSTTEAKPVKVFSGNITKGVNFTTDIQGFPNGGPSRRVSALISDPFEPNDTFLQATPLGIPSKIQAYVDPSGDLDVYQFFGTQGDQIVAKINASVISSILDSVLKLYDSNGNQIDSNDDRDDDTIDSQLSFSLPYSGLFFLSVEDFAGQVAGISIEAEGGLEHFYQLILTRSVSPPAILILPRSIDKMPFNFAFTIFTPLGPANLDEDSFSFSFNNINITEIILDTISRGKALAEITQDQITITFPLLNFPKGSFSISINISDLLGDKATNSVIYVVR